MSNQEGLSLREFVGIIWIADDPGVRLRVLATSAEEARRLVIDEYGEGHIITLRNAEDAARPRGGPVGEDDVTLEDSH